MEPITINATELRNKTRDLMERVKYHGDVFVVETFGRPMAVIMSVEAFQKAQALTEQNAMKKPRSLSKYPKSTRKRATQMAGLKHTVPLSSSDSEMQENVSRP